MTETDRIAMRRSAGERLALIAESYARLTGTPLVEDAGAGLEEVLWHAPRAIVAHGTGAEPLFFYGNRLALVLFAMPADEFIGLPSTQSAEPALRGERAAMLARLEAEEMIDDYSGVRIAADGSRFRIEQATVWNLVDADGARHGQAATFDRWTRL